jgi:hypothetical protein
MAVELATSLMDLACQFRRHMNLASAKNPADVDDI